MASLRTLRLKDILLTLAILIELPGIYRHITDLDSFIAIIGFLARIALLWGAILAAAHLRRAVIRWPIAILFAASAYALTVYQHTTHQFMTYDAFINLTNATDSFGEAFSQSLTALISAMAPTILLFLAMGLAPGRSAPLLSAPASLATPGLATIALALFLFTQGGDGGEGLPPSFIPIAYAGLAGYEAMTGAIGTRQPVQLPHISRPRSRNIVLVIDESIAGQYLDINSPRGVATPLSHPWPGIDIVNYGIAAAVSNCSASSNVTLRYGGTRADYRRIIATQPSIWAYAHQAGLRTVHIDAQAIGNSLPNFMTPAERSEIDEMIRLHDVPIEQRDMAVAQRLIRELADPRPKFILINKDGAHFPIQDRYPDQDLHYQPALKRGMLDPLNTGKQIGFSGTPPEWRLYRNSYRNTLLWNVGNFFDTLLRHGDFADTTMIYTSDHGQNLHEDGSSGIYTHCDPSPVPEEGAVPLLVIEGKGLSKIDWRRDMAHNFGRSSHFMIFPTLLEVMGYDPTISRKRYGPGLDVPTDDPGTFNILFNARLRRDPIWVTVDHAKISPPLLSDIAGLK